MSIKLIHLQSVTVTDTLSFLILKFLILILKIGLITIKLKNHSSMITYSHAIAAKPNLSNDIIFFCHKINDGRN
jgi:hypothetical protein